MLKEITISPPIIISLYQGHPTTVPRKYTVNTFYTIKSTFRSLKMHSKRRYKICVCSVIVEELETFRNYFPENFRCNFTYYESEIFLFPLSSHF